MQELMIFQTPEEWQGQGFPALRPQISPLSLGRGKLPFSPMLAAAEHENTGGQGKERKEHS